MGEDGDHVGCAIAMHVAAECRFEEGASTTHRCRPEVRAGRKWPLARRWLSGQQSGRELGALPSNCQLRSLVPRHERKVASGRTGGQLRGGDDVFWATSFLRLFFDLFFTKRLFLAQVQL